jgi:putative ABC transport system permease protein
MIGRFVDRYSLVLHLASILAFLALILCLLGIYGVAAFAVAQRAQEIGIRLAIGAQHIDVFRLIVQSIARPLMIGLPIGIALAAVLGTLFQRMELLVGVNPVDSLVYSGASLLIGSTALLATLIPALRSVRLNPWNALRDD